MASSESRSHYGCWTCRLRKKKCDETPPACSICVALELECHGYGDKPEWMDNGPLQREQTMRVKRIVSRTNSKRRKQNALHPNSPLADLRLVPDLGLDMDIAYTGASDALNDPSNYSLDPYPLDAPGWNAEALGEGSQFYCWNMNLDLFDKEILSASSEEIPFISESLSNHRNWENELCIDKSVLAGHDLIPSGASVDSEEIITTPTPSPSTEQKAGGAFAYNKSIDGLQLEANSTSATVWPWNGHPRNVQSLSSNIKFTQKYPTAPNYPNESVLRRELEDELFMHYLDEVFYIQYPFYNSTYKQSRSWLFSSLRRVKSVYHATLALSERHLQSTNKRSVLPTQFNKPNYYYMALQEMRLPIGATGPVHSMDGITCILQILFYELFAGGSGNWQAYLHTAATLLLPLVKARMESNGRDPTGLNLCPLQPRDMLVKDDTGTKVLLGSLISFDIIACASTRSQPCLKLDHKRILDIFSIDLGSLFGCANQVMILILEIALLDNWKKEAEKNRQLSMVELVKRGAKIEERLQQEIKDLESVESLGLSSEGNSGNTLSASRNEITNIFTLSALTYLNVVISGAQPELPEIVKSVSKTIAAFRCLSEPRLLRNLVWPLCVSGCLALKEHQSFFRNLVSKADVSHATLGTCAQAFKIVEQCWEMRETCSFNCDWVYIMTKLGSDILLI